MLPVTTMARPLRIHIPGRAYHLFARGDNKAPIFRDDADCVYFLALLGEGLSRFAIECAAYCLVVNHYHLLVIPRLHSVSVMMQYVNSRYCQWFNRKHGRVGHVLQGRFGSTIVDDAAYMLTALRYIAVNPVAAKLTAAPDEWQWSSYRATAGLEPAPDFLSLDRVWSAVNCSDIAAGRRRYIGHVAGGVEGEELRKALLFGSERLARQVASLLVPHQHEIDFVRADRFAVRTPLTEIFAGLTAVEELKHAAAEAFHVHGYTLRDIGRLIDRTPSAVCRWIRAVREEKA